MTVHIEEVRDLLFFYALIIASTFPLDPSFSIAGKHSSQNQMRSVKTLEYAVFLGE